MALAALILTGSFSGCGKESAGSAQNEISTVIGSAEASNEAISTESLKVSKETPVAGKEKTSEEASVASSIELSEETTVINSSDPYEKADEISVEASSETSRGMESDYLLPEDGIYDSKEEVALYIHIYDKLPSNYITKKEARDLGWPGGDLSEYAPGKCIGGDRFGNNEGLLPEVKGRKYKECDIDTLGKKKRGAKRIIYSNDGYIYYTEDHYASYELLYEGD